MADYEFIDSTGVIVPDTGSVLETVRNEYREIFGRNVDVSHETPQGVLIAAETEARSNVLRNNAALANQINPDLAGGVFLDAIWSLTGGSRVRSTRTLVRGVVLTGRPAGIIPAGVVASTSDGDHFQSVGSVVLDANGRAEVDFQALEFGTIPCPPNQLTTIISGAVSLETVNNPIGGEIGRLTESDKASRLRRRRTLALQGVALPEAIVSGLYAVEGVKSLAFIENVTHSPLVVDGITLKPHSIYVCIDGGTDQDIAEMLVRKKSLGCGYNGNVTVDYVEPYSGQTYTPSFSRPELIPLKVRVKVSRRSATADPQRVVRDAIEKYARGEMDGEEGFVVGGDVSPFELAGAVNQTEPTIFVSDVSLSRDNGATYTRDEIVVLRSQLATVFRGNIEVIVN